MKENLIVDIDVGGSQVFLMTLTPEQPTNGQATDWKLVSDGVEIENVLVNFSANSPSAVEPFERCVLIISIDPIVQTDTTAWNFTLNGIQFSSGSEDRNHDISTSISNDGKTLTLIITDVSNTREDVKYSFVALHTALTSGLSTIFQSKDPIIVVNRRPG